ncbi:HPr kinase/phosphorylase [Asaia krungthepensis]|uniref:HPr kinase n=1 Tax=Asaia krungthepensis NRIC 0535 TaxID=1307925 RepID=A0ABQ0PVT2_9PROT|nr:hypothetical protein [Asaia krungthepensis]GBQ82879.1 HPr kinase [Asaia krungthepensis NRIC 0535]
MIVHEPKHNAHSQSCTSPFNIPPSGLVHGSCASLGDSGVLLTGCSGAGKSSLLLRLIDSGFMLVGDDQIHLAGKLACPASALAGLVEIRGVGLVQMPSAPQTTLVLHVHLVPGIVPERLPPRQIDATSGLWQITMDGFHADAVAVIRTVMRCIRGDLTLVCGVNGGSHDCLPLPSAREAR